MRTIQPMPINAMTVDVEDYFQVSAFEDVVPRNKWDSLPSRIERNGERILELFESFGIQATFFVLGWIAERFPNLVRQIVDAGHELSSHGFEHVRVTRQRRDDFRDDVRRTKAILEDVGACPVFGYRAASYSIGAENLWALGVLQEEGYRYSSSIYPIRHDSYGMPGAPRFAFRHSSGLLEIPVATVALRNINVPCGGGGYFRLMPYWFSRWAIRRVNCVDRQPCVFYFHPWEIDPDQPRQSGIGAKTRLRHYLNLNKTELRLRRLLDEFQWAPIKQVFPHAISE